MNYLSQITNPALDSGLQSKSGIEFVQSFIPGVIGMILVVGAVIFFFVLLVGAIQWISSGGDKNALESARGKITSALIGLVILLSVFAIIKLIENFFGISILSLDIAPLIIR